MKRTLLVLIGYILLALALTWPLVAQIGNHVPGTSTWSLDEYGYVWNNWWFKHAVFDLGQDPVYTNFLFYPVGTSLVLYTYTLLHVLLALPLQFAFGLVPATNATVLFSFVAAAFGMYLLVSYLLRASATPFVLPAAFISGLAFAFTSSRFVYISLGHYNVVATEWIPFYVLFLIKTIHTPRWKNVLLAGLFAALALYSETTDGVMLALLTLIYLAFHWRAWWQRAVVLRLVGIVLTAGILFSPLLIPTMREIFFSGYALPGYGHAEKLLVDLMGFFTPTSLHPLNRNWTAELDAVRQQISRFSDVNTFFVGYATALLALVGAVVFRKQLRVWIVSALIFASFTLGPLLHVNGQSVFDLDGLQVTFPLPFLLLHYIPLVKENRVPNRYSILVTFALAILIGYAVVWLAGKVSSVKLKVKSHFLLYPFYFLLVILLLFEHLALPLPLTDARVPEVYAQIAKEPGEFAVLSLPLGWRNSFGPLGAEDTRTQYYQAVHQKFIFGGNIQRNPPFLFDYFDRIPFFHNLTEVEFYREVSPEAQAADQAQGADLAYFFDIRYVVANAPIPNRPPYSDTRDATLAYVQSVLPLGEKIYDRDGVVAYRVNQPAPRTGLNVDFGTDAARLYQGEGWDRAETLAGASANWANQQNARLFVPIRELADYSLTLNLLPFAYPNAPAQTVEFFANGQSVEKLTLASGWNPYTITLPRDKLHPGINDITLRFVYLARPRDVLPADYTIGKTGVTSPVDITVQSTAEFASIKINGQEQSPLKRGYNLVVIHPQTGAIISTKFFDTASNVAESRALRDFVNAIPTGYIVAGAVQEEGATFLGSGAVTALKTLGTQVDLRGTQGKTHAFIGVKGAAAGTALEMSGDESAFLNVGHVPDDRTLAAAVDWVRVESKK